MTRGTGGPLSGWGGVTSSDRPATRRSGGQRGQRGQGLVEFALVAPILLFLFFAVLEGSLLIFTIGAFRYAASNGAIQAAELGSASDADTQAVQVVRTSPGLTNLATVTEIDIYRVIQSGGQFVPDASAYNKYNLDGSAISVTWTPASRNVRNGFTDFLGLTIYYTYSWRSGKLLGAQPFHLSQTYDVRLEPQSY